MQSPKFLLTLLTWSCLLLPVFAEMPDEKITSAPNPLYIDPASRDFSENADLLERILSGPHGYFRFINIPFSREICRRFENELPSMPSLNLHGDAHIEQYAMTDLGRGLTDYDDSSTGPGLIDLLRFGVSLELAAQANHWQNNTDELLTAFLDGYRKALENPEIEFAEPALSQKVRAAFTINRDAYFQWIASVMQPMAQSLRDSLVAAIHPYVETKLAEKPALTAAYFQVEDCGILQMGIGSALDMKFLVRIRGKSDDPNDDVMLEFKEVRDLSGIDCIDSGREKDPFRILVAQTRIAYTPFSHLGYFRFRGRNFWVHSWVDNYEEIKIDKSFKTLENMKEIVHDVGVQLGKGHVKQIASPLDLQLRREQLQLIEKYQRTIHETCDELTAQTISAWKQFCASAKK